MNKNLDKLRDKIDIIDDQLLRLIIKRSSIVQDIGKIKKKLSSKVDKNRESKVIERLLNLHKGSFAKDSIVRIWREIFDTSVNIQNKKNDNLKAKRGINDIKLYKGGVSKIKGIKKIIKLSSNESPFGPSLKSIKAYEKSSAGLSRYPELTASSLQEAIAKKNKLNSNQIITGTGSDEILIMTVLALCSPGDEIIHAKHGFEMYPIIAKYVGAESILANEQNYKLDINSVLKKITHSTKVILIANPNNPTGTYLSGIELNRLIKRIPKNIVVVIDTAYAEFADAKDYDKTFKLTKEFKNVLITRTFSKAYALAGLRLGWGYGSKNLIDIIKKVRPPFNLPPGAIAAGIAALQDSKHLKKVVNHNSKIKGWFANELKKFGFKIYDTQANFIFVIIPRTSKQSAKKLNNYLLSNGVAVRYLLSYGIENGLRITLGKKQELEKTLKIIKKFKKTNEK